ncbi:CO/COL/TOC1, conserved site-containing protein [Cynara cardunculus var. scolymus]|uniref:CO/COL/TOC1, conserved site-containing protein n=1 Tax=Cynara cardunculus var. scolymus TaxID=59895 RepID=A0A103XSS7_CYNCS|nr:CO/COL/TOC1, conserved site-containing protein [Cynara cardunculus var. scolymus]
MERDFMGLNSRATVVKEEALKEPVFSISSDVRWPFSNGFEAFNNHQLGEIQSANFLQLHHDTKQAVPVSMSSPFFRHHLAGASVNPQLFGGVPVMSPHLVLPSTGSFFAPTTESWDSSKAASASAQLTIFYGAGKGAFVAAANGPQPRGQAPTNPAGDAVYMSQPISTQPCSAVSSPMSVSSHPVPQSTANKSEAAKRIGGSTTPVTQMDTPRVMSSFRQARQSAVPQARKASLARFLEKRKERVMASVPYRLGKNSIGSVANSTAVIAASEQRV